MVINESTSIDIAIESLKFAIEKSNKIQDKDEAILALFTLVSDFYQWRGIEAPAELSKVKSADKYWQARKIVTNWIEGLEFSLLLSMK